MRRYRVGTNSGRLALEDTKTGQVVVFNLATGIELDNIRFSMADFAPLKDVWVLSMLRGAEESGGMDVLLDEIRGYVKGDNLYFDVVRAVSQKGKYLGKRLLRKDLTNGWMQSIFLYLNEKDFLEAGKTVLGYGKFEGKFRKIV